MPLPHRNCPRTAAAKLLRLAQPPCNHIADLDLQSYAVDCQQRTLSQGQSPSAAAAAGVARSGAPHVRLQRSLLSNLIAIAQTEMAMP
jgi:hypothetical protein